MVAGVEKESRYPLAEKVNSISGEKVPRKKKDALG